MTTVILQFQPDELVSVLRRIEEEDSVLSPFVNALSAAIETGGGVALSQEGWVSVSVEADFTPEMAEAINRSPYKQDVFVVYTRQHGEGVVVFSRPVTQGQDGGTITRDEIVHAARLGQEAHDWEDALRVADEVRGLWPIMNLRSTPFIKVVTQGDVPRPEFFDVVRAAVAAKCLNEGLVVPAFHISGASNAAAVHFLAHLVSISQDELARLFCMAYAGTVIRDPRLIATYSKYMPPVVIRHANSINAWRRAAKSAFLALNLLYERGLVGNIPLPEIAEVNRRELEAATKTLDRIAKQHASPKSLGAFSISQEEATDVLQAALVVLSAYQEFCAKNNLPVFPLAHFRPQLPKIPAMMEGVIEKMSSQEKMSLIAAAKKRGITPLLILDQVSVAQVAMASRSRSAEVQNEALRAAVERMPVILVVDTSGSMEPAINAAQSLARRFVAAGTREAWCVTFGERVNVTRSIPSSLRASGFTPGHPAILVAAELAGNIKEKGAKNVCAVVLTDCEFNVDTARVQLEDRVQKVSWEGDASLVPGLHYILVNFGRENTSVPLSLTKTGEEVVVIRARNRETEDIVQEIIVALLDIAERAKQKAVAWYVTGAITGWEEQVDYIRAMCGEKSLHGRVKDQGVTITIVPVSEE
jgi:hypothetical protein